MRLAEDTKRELVEALLRLNKISKNKAALSLDLKRQNLYAWLKGIDTAISNTKKLELLALLGVRNGELADDQIHRWCITNLEDARLVISILTSQMSAPQHLSILNIWPDNNSDAVLRLTTNDHHHVYLLLYYPLQDSVPPQINATTLGLGESMQSMVRLTKEQWTSWLKPDEISLGTVAHIVDHEIQCNFPPEELESLDTDQQADDDYYIGLGNQEPPKPTPEQLAVWSELLERALRSGKSFEQSLHMTKIALNLYQPNEKKFMP